MNTAVSALQLIRPLPKIGRKWRRPKHRFNLETKPYQIQPFLLAPVLPGDTLKTGMFQSRVVTDPINNPLVGWHQEYYFWYVKLTDTLIREQIPDLFMTEGYDASSVYRAANPATYHAGGGIDWAYECLRICVQEYFRDEEEAWDAALLDGLPMAQAFGREDSWMDSLAPDDDLPEEAEEGDEMAELYGEQYVKWQSMAALKLTDLTFEEWLQRAYNVSQPTAVTSHKPELIRFVKDWSYPSNTINPVDGAPSSAVSWSIAERISKNRFFREPGFVFGCSVTRPKVYLGNQKGSASVLLRNGMAWLPTIIMSEEPFASVINVPTGSGPLPNIADDGGYWADLSDLFVYGEQWVNFPTTTPNKSFVSLPNDQGKAKYPSAADIEALFKQASSCKIRQDGIVDLRILSRVEDTTK